MKILKLTLLALLTNAAVFAQSITVEPNFTKGIESKTELGINTPYLFYHLLNQAQEVNEPLRDEIISTDFDLLRFPGGTVANYYRFKNQGYGIVRTEVESVNNNYICYGGNSFWCNYKDQFATRNYIYDFIELAEYKFNQTGKKTDVLYVLNLLLHWVYNFNEFDYMPNINSIADLNQAVIDGNISEDFKERILDNIDAISLLKDNAYINITGIELGNELYFYQEITSFTVALNSNIGFNFDNSYNTLYPRMEKMKELIKMYKRLLSDIDSNFKYGFPVGGISHANTSTNINKVWNAVTRDLIMDEVDAIIPHAYMKVNSADANPNNIMDDENGSLRSIRRAMEEYINERFDKTMRNYDNFFSVAESSKKMWLTEWNIGIAGGNTTIWDEWSNMMLNGIFLDQIGQRIVNQEYYSNLISQSIFHTLTAGDGGIDHAIITSKNDGSFIKRIGYFSTVIAGAYLKEKNITRLVGNSASTQGAEELYGSYNFIPNANDKNGKFIFAFSNLRGDVVDFQLNTDTPEIWIDNDNYSISNEIKMLGYKGIDLTSSCGANKFSEDESVCEISVIEENLNGALNSISIPPYSSGYIEFNLTYNTTTSTAENVLSNFSIYPNPTTDRIRINSEGKMRVIMLSNALGQQVRSILAVNSNTYNLKVADLPTGTYFVEVELENGKKSTQQFVKLD